MKTFFEPVKTALARVLPPVVRELLRQLLRRLLYLLEAEDTAAKARGQRCS